MNRSMGRYIEVALLIMISFSPLLPQPLKATLVLSLFLLNLRYIKRLRLDPTVVLVMFMLVFAVSAVYDLRNIDSLDQMNMLNLYFPLCFLLGFLISQKYGIVEYLDYIEKLVFITAVFSLVGVFVYTFVPSLVQRLPVYHYYNTRHRTAFLFNVLTTSVGVVKRNAGIAWEPGAYQVLLNLGLYAYTRDGGRTSIIRVIIYSLAIIFTKSTAGLLIFMLILFRVFRSDKWARLLIVVSVVVFGGFIQEALIYQKTYKLFGSAAFAVRLEPMLEAFSFGNRYVFGIGNSGYDLHYRDITQAPWESIGQIFIRYGYPLLCLVLYRLLSILRNDRLLFAILAMTFMSQNIWFFPLITPFYFMDTKCAKARAGVGGAYEKGIVGNKYPVTRSQLANE